MKRDLPLLQSADPAVVEHEARLLVLSSLFPSDAQPAAGLFIRERMFRVARKREVVVVAPQPWFPGQGLVRLFRPHFRPMAKRWERMQGIEVHRPRFLCVPYVLKWTDGWFMALGVYFTARRLIKEKRLNLLDAHFGYPEGFAGSLLGRWLRMPMIVTLRGKEERQLREPVAAALRHAIRSATRVITVSEALKDVATSVGASADRVTVVGNGIDLEKFSPVPREEARSALRLPPDAKVMVSVGTLVERKGFHRVFDAMPELLIRFPNLHYLVVGGGGPEGDMSPRLRAQVASLGLTDRVHFLGPYAPADLKIPLSAADVFVLATAYEGWANVFLEAMACGLPVVTTRVGGNAEVVAGEHLGRLFDLDDHQGLVAALDDALAADWDRERIMSYARSNTWDRRIDMLLVEYAKAFGARAQPAAGVARSVETAKS
jgi:glycosyltransferase involved in cell wall biosynthesis